jgi:hypothetical protein
MMAVAEPPGLSARVPLLLLPVHVQYRFMPSELWVRIYPDQIHVNAHETALTTQEVADGKTYWTSAWAGDALAAWRLLANLYGAPRAAWIARELTPTNVSQRPSGTPNFPTVATRATSWEEPAVADMLPDAWTVVLVAGTTSTVARGTPITRPLAVSLTPNGAGFPAGSTVDAGLKWMVDFNTAVAAGMALKIPITAAQQSQGFDRLIVYGLRARQTDFSELLDAHHYTDGLAFIAQGSPTNNTPDAPSGYSRSDPNQTVSYATEQQGPLTTNPAANGATFATLLGLPLSTFDHIAGADDTGEQNASDMLGALWPATLGYFLTQMMANVFTPAQIAAARDYVLAHAYPRGPLPAFRVGRTPYGVLPVTSLQAYAMPADTTGPVETGLVSFIKKLWPTWLASSANAPHLGPGQDPDQNLLGVLGMDASSMAFQGRSVLGGIFLWNLLGFTGKTSQATWWQTYSHYGRALLDNYGYTQWDPRVITLGFANSSFPVTFPTVSGVPLSETATLAADANLGAGQMGTYIDWLRTASVADIQAENYPGPKPTSLLYKILRQSLLIEYTNLASATSPWQEGELIGLDAASTAVTPWQILARPSVANPAISWGEYLPTATSIAELNDLKASLTRLAQCPTAELDRLLTETLDACSHRLDVWATAIATSLLERTRAGQNAQSTPAYVGAYGWVQQIRPETGRVPITGTELTSVQALDAARKETTASVPLEPPSDNGGSIFAPSATQAAVAAVLRSGYMTHQQTPDANLLSIDLSSDRVRRALWLIAGVQQGQSLNALLGYLFEEGLDDAGLNQYVQPFRNAYPIVGGKLTPPNGPSETIAASNVVDGLALRTAWDNGQLPTGSTWGTGLPGPGADQNSVITILQTLDDYADALGDLSIAESVFQMVRGNYGGAALMDAISRGSRPPMPGVVDTPRGGTDLTHRVALLLAGPPTVAAAWSGIPVHPRAAAEPWLNAWLSQVLPDPATVQCVVQYTDQSGAAQSRTVSLRDLNLGPLDVVALSNPELMSRATYAASLPAGAHGAQVVLHPLATNLLYLAEQLRRLVGSARALEPQDLAPPEQNATTSGGVVDTSDLGTRATAAIGSLTTDLAALTTALGGSADALRSALLTCSFYGVDGAVPATSTGADPTLVPQAQRVIAALLNRKSAINTADPDSVFATIFGADFVVLPHFTPPSAPTVQGAFAQSAQLTSSDAQAPARWLRQLTHIRPGISRLDLALSAAQALVGGALYPPPLVLGQLPPATPDRWLALPIDPAHPPAPGRVALACVASGDPTKAPTYAGLLLDEWIERIPTTQESASLAFHYDEPDARAPQSLLLAVCPDNRSTWDDGIVVAILQETLELAQIRAVDLASIQQVGQILPALYFALNLHGATVSVQLGALTGNVNVTGIAR